MVRRPCISFFVSMFACGTATALRADAWREAQFAWTGVSRPSHPNRACMHRPNGLRCFSRAEIDQLAEKTSRVVIPWFHGNWKHQAAREDAELIKAKWEKMGVTGEVCLYINSSVIPIAVMKEEADYREFSPDYLLRDDNNRVITTRNQPANRYVSLANVDYREMVLDHLARHFDASSPFDCVAMDSSNEIGGRYQYADEDDLTTQYWFGNTLDPSEQVASNNTTLPAWTISDHPKTETTADYVLHERGGHILQWNSSNSLQNTFEAHNHGLRLFIAQIQNLGAKVVANGFGYKDWRSGGERRNLFLFDSADVVATEEFCIGYRTKQAAMGSAYPSDFAHRMYSLPHDIEFEWGLMDGTVTPDALSFEKELLLQTNEMMEPISDPAASPIRVQPDDNQQAFCHAQFMLGHQPGQTRFKFGHEYLVENEVPRLLHDANVAHFGEALAMREPMNFGGGGLFRRMFDATGNGSPDTIAYVNLVQSVEFNIPIGFELDCSWSSRAEQSEIVGANDRLSIEPYGSAVLRRTSESLCNPPQR